MKTIDRLLCVVALSLCACTVQEGDRCNPLLFNDDCTSTPGLTCQYPMSCGVAFCCPAPDKVNASTHVNCLACSGPDMSALDGAPAADLSLAADLTSHD